MAADQIDQIIATLPTAGLLMPMSVWRQFSKANVGNGCWTGTQGDEIFATLLPIPRYRRTTALERADRKVV